MKKVVTVKLIASNAHIHLYPGFPVGGQNFMGLVVQGNTEAADMAQQLLQISLTSFLSSILESNTQTARYLQKCQCKHKLQNELYFGKSILKSRRGKNSKLLHAEKVKVHEGNIVNWCSLQLLPFPSMRHWYEYKFCTSLIALMNIDHGRVRLVPSTVCIV